MLTLDKNPVTARDTELKAQELLNAFYKSFFDGQSHASQIEPTPVTFPVVDLFYNQTQIPAPADKPQLHTVFSDFRSRERSWSATEKIVFADCILSIFVRVANQGAEGNAADFLCRKTADQVKEIFQSQDRSALSLKGILHAKVTRGPMPVGTIGLQVRILIVTCQLQYKVPRLNT